MAAAFLALLACGKQDPQRPVPQQSGISFRLSGAAYEGSGQERTAAGSYDRVELAVADAGGRIVDGLKTGYDRASSTVYLEGLREGEYRLLVLGIKGDSGSDGAVVNHIDELSDTWLELPGDAFPLKAEYFYSSTPFSVVRSATPEGFEYVADLSGTVEQKRIVSRVDFSFVFSNPYVEAAALSRRAVLEAPVFYTGLSAGGSYSGASSGGDIELDVSGGISCLFFPTVGEKPLEGRAELRTRDLRGGEYLRGYVFSGAAPGANRISPMPIEAVHPEDRSGLMFVSEEHYSGGAHEYILQDGEHHDVYTDKAQRSFNTAEPLQISVTDDGRLHLRFYSPRDLRNLLVKAKIPGAGDEYFELAYFDRMPAFGDFYELLPLASCDVFLRSESGRIAELKQADAGTLAGMTFKIESDDPYLQKLQEIRHGWTVHFSLYGGDPEREDGGPAGNWMGIRPVHCREAVAFFLNFTYMIDMPEHEQILRDNQDRLYGNGGVDDKVSVETVLSQMRQPRTVQVGLVYTGNLVYGLGGGHVFGAYQGGWLGHYTSTFSCEIMFHELGHVMGYSHDSSFTYGPWAQELMNNFYVDHLAQMPVDSPDYLNSRQNPNLYPREPMTAAAARFICPDETHMHN